MNQIFLNIYGYKIILKNTDNSETRHFEFIKNKIEDDFFYFITSEINLPDLEIVILENKINTDKVGIYLGKTRMAKVFQISKNERFYDYKKAENFAQLKINFKKLKIANIFSNNVNLIYEIIYILILSSSGEYLDSIGLVRIHALGLVENDKCFIFYGSKGAGKSTLFTCKLNNDQSTFYSDEICLLDINSNMLKPFPIRIALHDNSLNKFKFRINSEKLNRVLLDEKNTYSFPKDKVAEPKPISFFIELSSFNNKSIIKNATIFSKILIFFKIVLGIGLIQMIEFLVRRDNLTVLIKILLNRIKAYKIIRESKYLLWERSKQLESDIDFINEFIRNSTEK